MTGETDTGDGVQSVRRRRVLYVPGYDPAPPRKSRERYRTQSARQAGISGHEITLGAKQSDGRFGWHVSARIDGAQVETEMEVLYWADIVRKSMGQGLAAAYGQLARTAWVYIGSGALFSLMRLRKGPVIAALYPVVVLLVQLLAALALGFIVYTAVFIAGLLALGAITGGMDHSALSLATMAASAGIGLWVAYAILRWCKRRDHLLAWYLMHDYAFTAQLRGAYPEVQEARMALFADRVAAALASDADEVLIVGHSSGAYIAVSVLADMIRAGRVSGDRPALSLLTLGHVVPMVSFLPGARRLRADLAYLSVQGALTWVDVTAPGDGCSFALCDPVAVSGVAPEGQRWPLVISAAFSQTLAPETWRALRWRPFEVHFQYLNAFDRPGDYDYFCITAGPLTLGQRFEGRAPSPGRKEAAVNRFTDRAA